MTELIVALDGPLPLDLLSRLHDEAGVRWFKIGPQRLFTGIIEGALKRNVKIFLDLKLADTADTVRETVRHAGEAGIAAISVTGDRQTAAALETCGDIVKVWRVAYLTDEMSPMMAPSIKVVPHGIICPVYAAHVCGAVYKCDIISPGIRNGGNQHGHLAPRTMDAARKEGVTYAVIGRPIWQAEDPVAAAKQFIGG